MLRGTSATNAAAFPNKFSEYLAAGLYVVIGKGTIDPARVVSEYGLGAIVDADQILSQPDEHIIALIDSIRVSSATRRIQTRRALESLSMKNTLRSFAEDMQR